MDERNSSIIPANFRATAETGIAHPCDKLRDVMNNDSPSGSSRPAAGGEFTWPPTREELDAIDVIPLDPLDDTSSIKPIAVMPAKAIASPEIARRGRLRLPLRLPDRDDLVYAGVICTSVLAIAVAASMQFSDLWSPAAEPRDPPIPAADCANPTRDVTDRDVTDHRAHQWRQATWSADASPHVERQNT